VVSSVKLISFVGLKLSLEAIIFVPIKMPLAEPTAVGRLVLVVRCWLRGPDIPPPLGWPLACLVKNNKPMLQVRFTFDGYFPGTVGAV
jgi:hypothetical protein